MKRQAEGIGMGWEWATAAVQGTALPHLGVEQQEQWVVGSGMCSPLQYVRQEQELSREAVSNMGRGSSPQSPSTGALCYLSRLVAVLQVGQLSPRGLCNPLSSNQVPHNHGGWSDLWKTGILMSTWIPPPALLSHVHLSF